MLIIQHCEECHNRLIGYGQPAYGTYNLISEIFLFFGEPFRLPIDEKGILQVVKFLEMKGLLISHETEDESIYIKPLGCHNLEEDYYLICFDQKEHD